MKLPYLPLNREILYVDESNHYMQKASETAKKFSLDKKHPTGAIIVKNNKILGIGANGSKYHEKYGCERKRQNIPTGTKYELCEGCHPHNHAEQTAIKDALHKNNNISQADLYLWGHWWCCQSCWEKMIKNHIANVYLVKNAYDKFGKRKII